MYFEELLFDDFDDFESVLKMWSTDTGKFYSTELEDDDTITFIYDQIYSGYFTNLRDVF